MFRVAIVGKPNVGKSTLFNRLIQQKKSIVHDEPGVTRDRIYGDVLWKNKTFQLIDTGGLESSNKPFKESIEKQVKFAINESDLILFVISAKEPINTNDYYVAKFLKKNKVKNVLLVANKTESNNNIYEKTYYSLGFSKPIFISSEHSIGIGDLLDEIVDYADKNKLDKTINDDAIKFCIIGKPNVGKSTLVNTLLNDERVIVSDVPGTTRDAIDCYFKYDNQKYVVIDTAGIKRKSKIGLNVDKFSVLRSYDAIKRAEIILILLDGSIPFSEQDEVIGGLAYKANIPTIIVVNKWDMIKDKTSKNQESIKKEIRNKFKFLTWAPIIFVSAKDKKNITNIFKMIKILKNECKIKISNSLLNDVLSKAEIMNQPPVFKGKRFKMTYITQTKSQIPTFIIFGNDPKHVHFSYARYLENEIRNAFGIKNVPITLYFKDKNSRFKGGIHG